MKQLYLAAGLLLLAGAAQAQGMAQGTQDNQGAPANAQPAMPAVVTHADSVQMQNGMPAKGHNSFTRKQALNSFKMKGYTHVNGLTKDSNGVWRANAMMNGSKQNVALDYQGNVTGQ